MIGGLYRASGPLAGALGGHRTSGASADVLHGTADMPHLDPAPVGGLGELVAVVDPLQPARGVGLRAQRGAFRSEERRVGKAWGRARGTAVGEQKTKER